MVKYATINDIVKIGCKYDVNHINADCSCQMIDKLMLENSPNLSFYVSYN